MSDLVQNSAIAWVASGAIMGGLFSGAKKIGDIMREPTHRYQIELIERPIRGVYHLSRIAAHTGWGATVGGLAALTAPVSMPVYIWWMSQWPQDEDPSSLPVPPESIDMPQKP